MRDLWGAARSFESPGCVVVITCVGATEAAEAAHCDGVVAEGVVMRVRPGVQGATPQGCLVSGCWPSERVAATWEYEEAAEEVEGRHAHAVRLRNHERFSASP